MPAGQTLGNLPGYTYDPIRARYFPTPKEPVVSAPPVRSSTAVTPSPRIDRDTEDAIDLTYIEGKGKRRRVGGLPARGYRRRELGGYGVQDRGSLSNAEHLAGLSLEGVSGTCVCHSDRITTLQNFAGGTFVSGTAGGKVIMQDHEGTTHQLGICSDNLVGLHFDVARMTIMAIAGSDLPHVHYFKRGSDDAEFLDVSTFDLQALANTDISCIASYDDVCVLGSKRMITSLVNYEKPSTTTRKLPSDPLSLDFGHDPHLIYAGMRNASVLLADLRTPGVMPTTLCRVPGGKAVVGVKRLDDGAVPYGLVASAMGNELLIYDTRFGRSPLHTLEDHVNTYHAGIDLALAPDSKFVFASGSDRRIGLWSTITGERIHPSLDDISSTKESTNPLRRTFDSMVQKLSVRDDFGLDIACGGDVIHHGRPGEVQRDRGRDNEEGDEQSSDIDL